jgi:hypothetical protein
MKKNILSISFLVIVSSAFSQAKEFSLSGKWQEIQNAGNDGAKKYVQKIENGRILIFESNNVLKDTLGNTGNYELKGDSLHFELSNRHYYFRLYQDQLYIHRIAFTPVTKEYEFICDEGCAFIYEQKEAYKRTVTGIVLDSKGNTLKNIQVRIKGTGTLTDTDSSGKFKIEAIPGNVLIVSNRNYQETQFLITNQTNYILILNENINLAKPSGNQKREVRKKDYSRQDNF